MAQTPDSSSDDNPYLLIIRFSSLGDIVQAAAVPKAFKLTFPKARVDWLVRSDFSGLLSPHKHIDKVISFERKQGFMGLLSLAWKLGGADYTHVYDAHSNVRSSILSGVLRLRRMLRVFTGPVFPRFARRGKNRFARWLLFRFRVNRLPTPFRGAESFHTPLRSWGIAPQVPKGPQFFPSGNLGDVGKSALSLLKKPVIALAPSAAWEMKRWPIEHWKTLIEKMPEASFALLGGPEDQFIAEIAAVAPTRVADLSGKLNFDQSASLLLSVDALVANDTGMLHIADQMEVPAVALIGPTAFGYPSHETSITAEISLFCKPCSKDGRGVCINSLYKRCLIEVTPERVVSDVKALLAKRRST